MFDSDSPLDVRDIEAVVKRYRQRISTHGVSFESMCSGSIEKQRIRHRVHAESLQGENPSVLDIGCGLGQFYQYLMDEERKCTFTGYDILPEYVEVCRLHFPNARFEARNIFSDGIDGTYDSIVLSQVLNNRYVYSDNMAVMKRALTIAYEATRVSVSVDMLSTYVDFQKPDVFHYPPEEIFAYAKTLTRRVCLRHDYRPWEFTIQLFHPEAAGYIP